MKIIKAGHVYELAQQDAHANTPPIVLTFVNREPKTEHPGTQTQEVLRALIDRTMHCDNCLRWPGNDLIIHHLRMALVLHESRALLRKTEKGIIAPENIETASADGHFVINRGLSSHDATFYERKPKPDSPYFPVMPDHSQGKAVPASDWADVCSSSKT